MTIRLLSLLVLPLAALAADLAPEFIYDTAPFPSCHASTVVELRNGDILSAWFGGTGEGKPDVAIWGARRSNGKWSAPEELVREPEIATFNPVLFHTKDGKLWLYYKFGPKPDNWSAGRRFSTDEGKTWSPVEHLPAGVLGPISPLGHVDPKPWEEVMAVNVTANWRLIRSLDPLLRQSDAGRVVMVTSGVAHRAEMKAYWGPYAVSKAALEALARTYAAETATTAVKVMLVNPGDRKSVV